MGKYDRLIKTNQTQAAYEREKLEQAKNGFEELSQDAQKTADLYANAEEALADIDAKFEEVTKLGKDDITFLFFAVALQCARQYLLTNFKERKSDKEAAKETKGHGEEHSKRKRGEWYLPNPEEIVLNPVPYDANRQIKSSKGALKGAGKMGHRLVLGHDPILGWVFGTANIATSTITNWEFKTYHVKTHLGNVGRGKAHFDTISIPVNTEEMLDVAQNRFFHEGKDGIVVLSASLMKEWIHLKSDIGTKNSLPFPVISTFSTELANKFADYGFDMFNIATVGKQASMAETINLIIGILHGMYCYYIRYPQDEDASLPDALAITHRENVLTELELSKVKTRKILMWSNVIASASNLLIVAGTQVAGVYAGDPELMKKGLSYMDVGGYLVTLYRLISDTAFIRKIKAEFLEKEWQNMVLGDEYQYLKEGIENE